MFVFQAPAPTLTLKKFDVDPETRTLLISGRASGLIGFILNLIGVSPTTTFSLLFDRVELTESKLSSESRKVFPLNSTESTECGHRRSIGYIVAAVILFFMGVNLWAGAGAMVALLFIGLSLVCVVGFFFSRRLFLATYCGSQAMVLVFKEATLGGERIDREVVMNAIGILNDRIAEAQSQNG